MTFHGNCPVCSKEIPKERYGTGFAICECGWYDTTPAKKAGAASEKRTIYAMVAGSVLLAVAYVHLATWGFYASSIPFVKIGQLTGTLSVEGHKELADACIKLGRIPCAKEAYLSLFRSTGDAAGLMGLARLQYRLQDFDAAALTYSSYFRVGGTDGDAMLEYAKVLEFKGQLDEAVKFYDQSIVARPTTLSIAATTGIVRILTNQGQLEAARDRIVAFHGSAENAKNYLTGELQSLETALGKTARGSKKRAQPKV